MVELVALLIAAAGPTPVEVYTANLGEAVLATARGKAIAAELGRLERQENAAIRREEQKLSIRRASMTSKAYAAAVDRLAERTKAAAAKLDAEQERLLAPELAKLTKRMKAAGAKDAKVLPAVDAPFIGAPRACDVTAWVTTDQPLPRSAACRFDWFFYVRFDDVLAKLDVAAKVKARLDAAREHYQKELDASQKALAKARGGPGGREAYVARAAQVEAKYAALQRRLEADERREQDRLYGRIENAVRGLARRTKGAAWVESIDGASHLKPSCDVSGYVAELLNGTGEPGGWLASCPDYAKR